MVDRAELTVGIQDKLREQIDQVLQRAQGQRNLRNWFALRHNRAILFQWCPIYGELILQSIAGDPSHLQKSDGERLVEKVIGEFVDLDEKDLGENKRLPGPYLVRTAEWRGAPGIIFRRTEGAPFSFNWGGNSALRMYETRWTVEVAK